MGLDKLYCVSLRRDYNTFMAFQTTTQWALSGLNVRIYTPLQRIKPNRYWINELSI